MDTETTEIYRCWHTLSPHDALPISFRGVMAAPWDLVAGRTARGLPDCAAALDDVALGFIADQQGRAPGRSGAGARHAAADARDDGERKSTRLNSSHKCASRMPSSR